MLVHVHDGNAFVGSINRVQDSILSAVQTEFGMPVHSFVLDAFRIGDEPEDFSLISLATAGFLRASLSN